MALLLSLFLSGLAEELWDTGTALWLATQGNPLLLGVQHAIGWGTSALASAQG